MKKIYPLLLVCLSFLMTIGLNCYSQEYPNELKGEKLPQVFSPTAASLGEYGKIPVSYFNGLPNISIPIGEVQGVGGISLPITLSYHGGGNRPDIHPGWVGQGWCLHAGGCINRIVNTLKDETDGLEANHYLNAYGGLGLVTSEKHLTGYYYKAELMNDVNVLYDKDGRLRTLWDCDPDEYQINVDGLNASFYFIGENKVKIKSKEPVSFTVNVDLANSPSDINLFHYAGNNDNYYRARRYTYFRGFTVTKNDGTIYRFGYDDSAIEYSFIQFCRGGQLVASANTWHLIEIIHPNGETFSFEYEHAGLPIIKQNVNSDCYIKEIYHIFDDSDSFSKGIDTKGNWKEIVTNKTLRDSMSVSYTILQPSYLNRITSKKAGDEAVFWHRKTTELSYCSEDDYTKLMYRLDNHLVPSENICKEDYYHCLHTIMIRKRSVHNFFYSEDRSKRLTLEAIRVNDFNGRRVGGYCMSYNSLRLPKYNSKRTDHWGYYNGKQSYEDVGYCDLESYRTPSPYYMKAEILERITYPTGGYTELIYEPHSFSRKIYHDFNLNDNVIQPTIVPINNDNIAGGLRIKQIRNVIDGKAETKSYEYINEDGRSSGILSGDVLYEASGELHNLLYVPGPFSDKRHLAGMCSGNYTISSEHLPIQLSSTDGSHITYDRVIENSSDGSRIVYSYYNHNDCPDERITSQYGSVIGRLPGGDHFTSCELFRGQLKKKEIFNRDNRLKQEERYVYEGIGEYDHIREYINAAGYAERDCFTIFRCYVYKIYTACPKIRRKISTTYPDTGPKIEDITLYNYNQDNLISSVTNKRGSDTEEIRFRYIGDLKGLTHGDIYEEMNDAYMVAIPLEITKLRNGRITDSKLLTYKSEFHHRDKAQIIYNLVPEYTKVPDCLYSMSLKSARSGRYQGFNGTIVDESYSLEREYLKHDFSDNLLVARGRDDMLYNIKWGFGDRYPIMISKNLEVEKLHYENFEVTGNYNGGFNSEKAFVGEYYPSYHGAGEAILEYKVLLNGKWVSRRKKFNYEPIDEGQRPIDEVRVYPSGAMIESYTWKPGVGLLSKTDCRGYTESYSYDAFTRLTGVFDDSCNPKVNYVYKYIDPVFQITENYITQTTYTAEDGQSYYQDITKLDGLGRVKSVINTGGSPDGEDILSSFIEYDGLGRKSKEWLPVPGQTNSPEAATAFYDDSRPFVEYVYDGTPLETVREVFNPGERWNTAGRSVKTRLLSNGNDPDDLSYCHAFSISWQGDTTFTIRRKSAGSLTIQETTDEAGTRTLEFKDMFGQNVLRRIISSKNPAEKFDTYLIYDELGRLAAVLPPILADKLTDGSRAEWNETMADFGKYGYFYRYDGRGNVIWKRLPGCGWTRYIYDKADRLVFSQDGEQRSVGKAWFSLMDCHGRECVTGLCTNDLNVAMNLIADKQILVSFDKGNNPSLLGYIISDDILENPQVMGAKYYDNVAFINNAVPATYRSRLQSNFRGPLYGQSGSSVGLNTGIAERIMGEEPTDEFRWTVIYYDKEGRPYMENHTRVDHGVDVVATGYSFSGKPLNVLIEHNPWVGKGKKEYYKYTYDHRDRLLSVSHSLDEKSWTVLSDNEYDGIGRKIADIRNGDEALKMSYSYNVRSWATDITGPGLTENITYDLGGHISNITWNSGSELGDFTDSYQYDGVSRLTRSYRRTVRAPYEFINEYTYDKQGNILNSKYEDKRFSRISATGVEYDAFFRIKVFNYDGNQLLSGSTVSGKYTIDISNPTAINSQSASFCYDRTGRLTLSEDQGMTEIRYNAVGFPSYVGMSDGGYVHNTYTAGGTRLESRRMEADGTVTTMAYEGNEVIENGDLRMLLFDGGYVDFSGSEPRYCWYTKDHLGSVRGVADVEGNVFNNYDYGPYGEDFAVLETAAANFNVGIPGAHLAGNTPEYSGEISQLRPGATTPVRPLAGSNATNHASMQPTATYSVNESPDWQPYKFSGKESLTRVGLELYDFGARMYSPTNMRWMTMDPLAEKYYHISPYAYCAGNPINRIDPDGMDDFTFTSNADFEKVINDDPYDRLIFDDGSNMIVKDKSIMANMEEHPYDYIEGQDAEPERRSLHYTIVDQNSEELMDVFTALADHTNVEWGLYTNEGGQALLGTQHRSNGIDENAISFYSDRNDTNIFDNLESKIHNHPSGYKTEEDSLRGDMNNMTRTPDIKSFVYFPESKNYYQLAPNNAKLIHNRPKL